MSQLLSKGFHGLSDLGTMDHFELRKLGVWSEVLILDQVQNIKDFFLSIVEIEEAVEALELINLCFKLIILNLLN
jgi:hypothetical protein